MNPTIGIIARNCHTVIKECKINRHLKGAILVTGDETNAIKIHGCKFYKNKEINIEVTGINCKPVIEQNIIFDSDGVGIKVHVGSSPKIVSNLIKKARIGIECISSDPIIFKNKIELSLEDGILSRTYKTLFCEAKIELNELTDNEANGIYVKGQNNHTHIEHNHAIYMNKRAGIAVDDKAFPKILRNKISNNLHQGILVIENSNAFIEGNHIFQNIKANIACGGEGAQDTTIIRNRIYQGVSEGVFVMLCGKCSMYNNDIYHNYDGIVVMEACPDISFNRVRDNKSVGIMLLRGSMPILKANNILGNECIGLFIREKSLGEIVNNVIEDNELEVVSEFFVDGVQTLT